MHNPHTKINRYLLTTSQLALADLHISAIRRSLDEVPKPSPRRERSKIPPLSIESLERKEQMKSPRSTPRTARTSPRQIIQGPTSPRSPRPILPVTLPPIASQSPRSPREDNRHYSDSWQRVERLKAQIEQKKSQLETMKSQLDTSQEQWQADLAHRLGRPLTPMTLSTAPFPALDSI